MAACLAAACSTPRADNAQTDVAKAFTIAGDDLKEDARVFCPDLARGPSAPASAQALQNTQIRAIPPTKVFDNLYYLGGFRNTGITGAWALVAKDEIVLINALTTARYAEDILVADLRKLGLDPAHIHYVLIAHGHGDQYGGADYLADKYGARRVMAAADWAEIDAANKDVADPASRLTRRPNDIAVSGATKLTIGGADIQFIPTPGHTPGTLSMLLPIQYRGATYTAMLWGGGGQQDAAAATSDISAFVEAGRRANAVALLTSRLSLEGGAHLQTLRDNPSAPNPFFYGAARMRRLLDVMTTCRQANLAVRAASPTP